jgi:hypothetical protein
MIPSGAKKHSLSSLLWGFGYKIGNGEWGMGIGESDSNNGIASGLHPYTSNNNPQSLVPSPQSPLEYVPAKEEKLLRERRIATGETVFSLRRVCLLAKNITTDVNPEQPWESYFNVYGSLYNKKN